MLVRRGAAAWRGVLRLPLAIREVGEDTEARMPTQDPFSMNILMAAVQGRMSKMWMSSSLLADHV